MLVNLSEMSSHDELHDHGMLGATESLINLSEMSSHDELHDHHMLGAMAPELMNLVSEMKMHDELHDKSHMLGAVLNPFHVSPDAPVHGFKDIKIVNKRNDLTGYDVKPKMMLVNLSEMSSHDELHDHGMLGATESLINLSEMSSHDELHDHHMLGAMAPELMNLVSEMKMHDELHEKPHMLGAVLN